MANTTLTQTGAQVQADLDLLDNNQATQGQVLTADGSGGCAWTNAYGFYLHTIVTSAYTFYIVNRHPTAYRGSSMQMRGFLSKIASTKWIGTQFSDIRFAYAMEIAVEGDFGDLTQYKESPSILQKGNAISYFGNDGQEVTILASNFGTFVSDTVTELQNF